MKNNKKSILGTGGAIILTLVVVFALGGKIINSRANAGWGSDSKHEEINYAANAGWG